MDKAKIKYYLFEGYFGYKKEQQKMTITTCHNGNLKEIILKDVITK
jgi:hypothetical protein